MKKLNKFFLENPEIFRKVVLTDFQIKIFKAVVKYYPIDTVKELSKELNMKPCTLTFHLKALCGKGYLTRKLNRKRINVGEYHYSVSL